MKEGRKLSVDDRKESGGLTSNVTKLFAGLDQPIWK